MTDGLDPTLHVIPVRGSDRREDAVTTSTKFDAWPFYIDRGGLSVGIINRPERVRESKAQRRAEIAQLKADASQDPSALVWGR
jgi:hypothetical protein